MNRLVRIFKAVLRCPVKFSMRFSERGDHITRYQMYGKIKSVLDDASPKPEDEHVLSISHSERLCKTLSLKNIKITEANFPEYNILELPFSNNFF